MKRETALSLLRVAGYHEDHGAFTRIYVENRVSFKVANEQFAIGRKQRAAGVPCTCFECKKVDAASH